MSSKKPDKFVSDGKDLLLSKKEQDKAKERIEAVFAAVTEEPPKVG